MVPICPIRGPGSPPRSTGVPRSSDRARQTAPSSCSEGPDVVGPTTEDRVGSVIRQALLEPGPVLTEARVYPLTGFSLPLFERFRFGVVLAASIAVAAVVARVLHGPHSFWLPLTVADIARRDLGPLISRAMERTFGTWTGVGIAAAVFWSTAPSLLPSAQVERSRRAVSSYEACDQRTDVNKRYMRRRRAFRGITDARASVMRAVSEPLAWRRPDPGLLQQLDRLSIAIDAHTVAILTEEAN